MGERGLYILVRGRTARAYTDTWGGSTATDVFAGGPEECVWLAESVGRVDVPASAYAYEGGFLLDEGRRRAMVFGDLPAGRGPDWIADAGPRWEGWALEHVDDADAFTRYLDAHGIPIEPDPDAPVRDAVADAVERTLGPVDESRMQELRHQEASLPPVPARRGQGCLVAAPALALGLCLALVLLPWRARLRARAAQRQRANARAAPGPEARGRMDDVARHSEALRVDPDDVDARVARAEALLELGQTRRAEEDLGRAAQLLPRGKRLGEVVALRAGTLSSIGFPRLAQHELDRARALGAELRPPSLPSRMRFAWQTWWVVVWFMALHFGADDD